MKISLEVDDFTFSSEHEVLFYAWCKEAKEHGLITDFKVMERKNDSFELTPQFNYTQKKTMVRVEDKILRRELLKPWTFCYDFELIIQPNDLMHRFTDTLNERKDPSERSEPAIFVAKNDILKDQFAIDIKGAVRNPMNSASDTTFPYNQKMMMMRYGIYVHPVVLFPPNKKRPKEDHLFCKTFVPELYWDFFVYQVKYKGFKPGDLKPQYWVPQVISEFKDRILR